MHRWIAKALEQNRNLLEPEALALLRDYHMPVPRYAFVAGMDVEEAVRAAEDIGYPVVVKIVSRDILHKSDVGGVQVGLGTEQSVRAGCAAIMRNLALKAPAAELDGLLVMEQALAGTECISGALRDPQFGTALMFGLGGVFVEALADVSFQLLPVTPEEALEMTYEIRASRLLDSFRGKEAADRQAIARWLCALGALAEAEKEIAEIDVNPLFVYPRGVLAADVRIILKK